MCRTVPDVVFALLFVIAFGLGPMVGVLAIAIHTTGALGKLFAEVVENIDMRPVDGLSASGASWVETVRFAVLPQVLSNFASYALLRFEINVRGAAVLGFVGAGGIGQEFLAAIRNFYYARRRRDPGADHPDRDLHRSRHRAGPPPARSARSMTDEGRPSRSPGGGGPGRSRAAARALPGAVPRRTGPAAGGGWRPSRLLAGLAGFGDLAASTCRRRGSSTGSGGSAPSRC